MRILLVNPRDNAYRPRRSAFARSVSYPALTLTTIAGLVPPELDAEVRILDEGVDETPIDFDVDVMGITVLAATSSRAYRIADEARRRGVHVVLGGYHASCRPEEAADHADTVIEGQADDSWPAFLRDFAAGRARARYTQDRLPDISGRPLPRRDLLKPGAYLPAMSIAASRGCRNGCRFCADSQYLGRQRIARPIVEVVAEIEQQRAKQLIFLDPNFHGDRDYSKELMRALEPLGVSWYCLSTVGTGLDEETLGLMRSSGCRGALVGFESVCQRSLGSMKRAGNRVERYHQALAGFRRHRISVLGCFVLGFDDDERTIFDETLDFVLHADLDLVRYAVLTPLPGTALHDELAGRGRIIEHDLTRYDFQHVVFEPARMSPQELRDGLSRCWRETYRPRRIARRVLRARQDRVLTLMVNLAFTRYYRRLLVTAGASE